MNKVCAEIIRHKKCIENVKKYLNGYTVYVFTRIKYSASG